MDIKSYPITLESAYRLIQNHNSGKQQVRNATESRQQESTIAGMQCSHQRGCPPLVSDSESDDATNARSNQSTVAERDGTTIPNT